MLQRAGSFLHPLFHSLAFIWELVQSYLKGTHTHSVYHITSHMLIHVHGCICLLQLECQTTGRTPESQAESIVMQHYTRQLLFRCTFKVSILHMYKEIDWICCRGLTDLISLRSSTSVYCCSSLFLETSTHEFTVGFVASSTAHLQSMGNGLMALKCHWLY